MRKATILTGPLAGHGGEETVIANFVELLSDQFVFDIVLSENAGEIKWLDNISAGIGNKYIKNTGSVLGKFNFIFKRLYKAQSDVVICLTPKTTFLARIAKMLFFKKYRIVTWVHFAINSKFGSKTAKLLKQADFHLAINSGIRQELLSLGVSSDRILLTYNPVEKKKRIIPKTQKKKKFIYIARIQYAGEKNLSELLEALSLLPSKENWALEIYGADDSPQHSETNKCNHLIKQFNLEENVHWCGFKKNVWDEISSADCLILTSTSEGFGMVLCEAISYGVPVISSNCPSGPADIVNSQNGYLYQMGNKKQLASLMARFISGETDFSTNNVKDSIKKMYSAEYKGRVEGFLDDICR